MYVPFYNRFIGGPTIKHAIATVNSAQNKWMPIYDYAQEGRTDMKDISSLEKKILSDIDVLIHDGNPSESFLALKSSSFGSNKYSFRYINNILNKANQYNIPIVFDAETSNLTKIEDEIILKALSRDMSMYKTYQMYRKDSMDRLLNDLDNYKIKKIKLVRGAYMRSEENKSLLFADKTNVDNAYDDAVRLVLQRITTDPDVQLMVATHNQSSIIKAVNIMQELHMSRNNVFFAQLLGMGDIITKALLDDNYKTCKYVPYGSLIETFPYMLRRLYENSSILKYA